MPTPTDAVSGGERNSVLLGPGDRLEGRLYVEGDLLVAGTVDGSLEATGDVEIDGGGKVRGPVTARHRLVVGPRGSLKGDVRVARLVVQDGATFSGNVAMVKPGEKPPAPAPASQAQPIAAAPEPTQPAPAPAPPAAAAAGSPEASSPATPGGKPADPKGKRR